MVLRQFFWRRWQCDAYERGKPSVAASGFFDGHVDTLGDLEAARPEFWFPKGTQVTNVATQFDADVRSRYGITSAWTAP